MGLERKPFKKRKYSTVREKMNIREGFDKAPMQRVRSRIRKSKPKGYKKGSTAGKLIDRLDRVFSLFIRARGSNEEGVCKCYTCGTYLSWKKKKGFQGGHPGAQCGHFRGRGNMSTRWNPENSRPQCSSCNENKGGNLKVYKENLIKDLGKEAVDKLYRKSNEIHRYTIKELKQKLDYFKKELKKVVESKGLKY